MNRPYRPRLAALLLAQIALAASVHAQTLVSWDAGAGANTLTSNATNWNLDTVPAFGSTIQATMTTGGNASVDNNMIFGPTTSNPALQFGGNFNLSSGGGNVTVYGTNTGTTSVLRVNSAVSATNGISISAPLKVFVPTSVAPVGNLLTVVTNGNTVNNVLNITGGISLASGSTGTTYDIRYSNGGTVGTNFSGARIAGSITGLNAISNGNVGAWRGSLTIAGNQTLNTSGITISSSAGFATPSSTAKLILGESAADVQTWNNVTLNNVMNVAVGGNITFNALSTSVTAATKITGIAADLASAGTLRIASGTVNTVSSLGGNGTNENNLNITKYGSNGTLTLNGTHTFAGNTTVEAGTLVLNGTLASPVILNAGATISGEGTTTGSLTFAPGSSTLSFDANTPTSALTAASLSVAGSSVVVTPTGTTSNGTPYTVLKLSNGTFTGNATDNFLLGSRGGSLSYTNNSTELTFTAGAAAPATLIWTGANGTNPTFWDAATTVNWTNNSTADRYFAGDSVIFDDNAASTAVAIQGASVSPGAITFNNSSAKNYTLSGGIITGAATLTKSGNGTLSLSTTGTSTFSGGITLNDGVLDFTSLNQLGLTTAPAIQINGGTLRLSGGTSTGGPAMTFNANATIDITGPITTTLRLAAKISGTGNITKSGTGVLALGTSVDSSPLNDFTGTLTVTGGAVDIRHSDSLGSTAAGTNIQGATLLIQNFGQTTGTKTFNAEPLAFTGTSYINLLNQENKDFTNQLTGPITVGGNGTLNISTAITSAAATKATILEFTNAGTIVTETGSTLAFGSRPALPLAPATANQTINVASPISGNGSVVVDAGAGSVITFDANNTYAGNTTITTGTLKLNSASLPDTTTLNIATGGNAKLDLSASDTVNKLFIGSTQQNAGTYTSADASGVFIGAGTLTVTTGPAPSNTAPTVTDITNQSIPSGASTTALSFTVDDAETPVGLLTLTGSSSNTSLVPNGNIVFGGTGANRTVTVTPISGNTGTATITITVTDDGSPALSNTPAETFVLTVTENYLSWAKTNGIEGQPASGDFDGDGIPNLLEYATNTSPTASGGTAGFSVAPSGNNLALTYTRVADPALTYAVEGSSDLTGAWSTLAVAGNPSTGVANVAGNVTITDPTPFTSGKRFLRLKVSQP